MKTVSVIVPVYNVESYLKRCLNSLVNQTLNDIELILVNDASTDNSLNILKNYASEYNNIIVIDSKVNLRQGGARNLGIQKATGEYIGFVDSDDWVSLDMFEKLYKKAVETNSDVVDSDYHIANDDSILEVVTSNTTHQLGDLTLSKKKSLIINTGRMWTKIFKREIFSKHNISFPEKLTYEDNPVLPILLANAQKLSKVEEPLYFYFKNTNSTTTIKDSYHHFDRLKTSIILLEEFKDRALFDTYQEELEYRFTELYYMNTIYICLSKFRRPEVDYLLKMRKYMRENFPEYRKNQYFNLVGRRTRIISKINDINPYILVSLYNFYNKSKNLNPYKKSGVN